MDPLLVFCLAYTSFLKIVVIRLPETCISELQNVAIQQTASYLLQRVRETRLGSQ
jgi:hypothetical protein